METPLTGDSRKKKPKAPSLACGQCRKKKVKCSGKPPPCLNCVHSGNECVFATHVKPRRTPVRSARRIDGLEDRLSHIEALLDEMAKPRNKGQSPVAADNPSSGSSSSGTYSNENSANLSASSRPTSREGQPPASAVPISVHTHDASHRSGFESAPGQSSASLARAPLPPFLEAIKLANTYFSTLNRWLPLFNEVSIIGRLQNSYHDLVPSDPAPWAAVNVVLALSHQLSAMHPNQAEVDHEKKTQDFLQNAISVVDQLSLRAPNMLSAQSLVGIARILQASPTPDAADTFLSMAARQIYRLGLHRQSDRDDFNLESFEWRRRSLWMAYSVDKDFSLRLNQPHILRDQDLALSLPDPNPIDGLGLIPSTAKTIRINYFRLHVDLAVMQSKIYERLYSARPPSQPENEAEERESICDLAMGLERWKGHIPVQFQPTSTLLESFPQSSVIAMIILYVRYFNCLTMTHRLSYWNVGHLETYRSSFEDLAMNPCPTQALCVQAARVSLQLFSVLPHGNVPCMWLLTDYFTSAAVILLAGIVYNAPFSLGWQDLQLIRPVMVNLELLATHGDAERLTHIRANCVELESAARRLLAQSYAENVNETHAPFIESAPLDDETVAWLQPSAVSA